MRYEHPEVLNKSDYENKVKKVIELLDIKYTEEEKKSFDEWLENLPSSNEENPLEMEGVEEVIKFLPSAPNYKNESKGFFFKLKSQEDLTDILKSFAAKDPDFEIAIMKFSNSAWLEIGGKANNLGPKGEEFIGHVHPASLLKNSKSTGLFRKALIPSPGDVRGFLKTKETIRNGTVICSSFGTTTITPSENILEFSDSNEKIQTFANKYFGEFLGENHFQDTSAEGWQELFKQEFGLNIYFQEY